MFFDKTCRDELIESVRKIVKNKGENKFKVSEVITFMKQNGTVYEESTIRTHITSRCCKNAPQNHASVYEDFERIGNGIYKLL
jgi:hypothetical protein